VLRIGLRSSVGDDIDAVTDGRLESRRVDAAARHVGPDYYHPDTTGWRGLCD
jgi:hypothetical protein